MFKPPHQLQACTHNLSNMEKVCMQNSQLPSKSLVESKNISNVWWVSRRKHFISMKCWNWIHEGEGNTHHSCLLIDVIHIDTRVESDTGRLVWIILVTKQFQCVDATFMDSLHQQNWPKRVRDTVKIADQKNNLMRHITPMKWNWLNSLGTWKASKMD